MGCTRVIRSVVLPPPLRTPCACSSFRSRLGVKLELALLILLHPAGQSRILDVCPRPASSNTFPAIRSFRWGNEKGIFLNYRVSNKFRSPWFTCPGLYCLDKLSCSARTRETFVTVSHYDHGKYRMNSSFQFVWRVARTNISHHSMAVTKFT